MKLTQSPKHDACLVLCSQCSTLLFVYATHWLTTDKAIHRDKPELYRALDGFGEKYARVAHGWSIPSALYRAMRQMETRVTNQGASWASQASPVVLHENLPSQRF